MEMRKDFDPDKIIDYNKDYYAILGIEPGSLIECKTTKEKQEVAVILEQAFRRCARVAHPDFDGGSAEAFKLVVQAHTILSDPLLRKIYESKGEYKPSMIGDGSIQVDWSNFGTYRKGTIEDTVGYALFFDICNRKEELGLIPAFHPIDEFDNYEWDWVIDGCNTEDGRQYKLALSLVYDENDVLRLTNRDTIDDSLPFKIYLCVPRSSLYFLRGEEEKVTYEDGSSDTLIGELQAATYSDFEIFETTVLSQVQEYINNSLAGYLEKFRSGDIVETQQKKDLEANQNTWISPKQMKELDIDVLKAIMRMKTFRGIKDENADNFLDDIVNQKKE
jgi:curved DNA-binding protein CbpA